MKDEKIPEIDKSNAMNPLIRITQREYCLSNDRLIGFSIVWVVTSMSGGNAWPPVRTARIGTGSRPGRPRANRAGSGGAAALHFRVLPHGGAPCGRKHWPCSGRVTASPGPRWGRCSASGPALGCKRSRALARTTRPHRHRSATPAAAQATRGGPGSQKPAPPLALERSGARDRPVAGLGGRASGSGRPPAQGRSPGPTGGHVLGHGALAGVCLGVSPRATGHAPRPDRGP